MGVGGEDLTCELGRGAGTFTGSCFLPDWLRCKLSRLTPRSGGLSLQTRPRKLRDWHSLITSGPVARESRRRLAVSSEGGPRGQGEVLQERLTPDHTREQFMVAKSRVAKSAPPAASHWRPVPQLPRRPRVPGCVPHLHPHSQQAAAPGGISLLPEEGWGWRNSNWRCSQLLDLTVCFSLRSQLGILRRHPAGTLQEAHRLGGSTQPGSP